MLHPSPENVIVYIAYDKYIPISVGVIAFHTRECAFF